MPPAEVLKDVNPGHVQLFFSFYFAMTGLHAAHMVIGIGILLVLLTAARRGTFSARILHAGRNDRACTGTSSTSCGCFCFRSCT